MKRLIYIFLLCMVCSSASAVDWDKLVSAVIEVESHGDTNAVSPAGAIGLMQITPVCLKEFVECPRNRGQYLTDFGTGLIYRINGLHGDKRYSQLTINLMFSKSLNVSVGTWYLKRLKNHYKCPSIEHILAANNGGITRLRRNGWDISKMPRESREYVRKVMVIYEK